MVLAVVFSCLAWQAAAQYPLEIIALKHRTAEQVLPALQPLLEPGATLTGQSNQLIVRASPRNLSDIRRALEAIDRPLRRLQISVRFDDAFAASRESLGASGQISNRGARIALEAEDLERERRNQIEQRVQVLEGGRAYIATGQSRPIPQRQRIQTPAGVVTQETFVIQDTASGFDVVPRLAGDLVFLESPGGTVQARLGEWIELGATSRNAAREGSGVASMNRSSVVESRRVWLKVEEIAN